MMKTIFMVVTFAFTSCDSDAGTPDDASQDGDGVDGAIGSDAGTPDDAAVSDSVDPGSDPVYRVAFTVEERNGNACGLDESLRRYRAYLFATDSDMCLPLSITIGDVRLAASTCGTPWRCTPAQTVFYIEGVNPGSYDFQVWSANRCYHGEATFTVSDSDTDIGIVHLTVSPPCAL